MSKEGKKFPLRQYRRALYKLDHLGRYARYVLWETHLDGTAFQATIERATAGVREALEAEIAERERAPYRSAFESGDARRLEIVEKTASWWCDNCGRNGLPTQASRVLYEVASRRKRKPGVQARTRTWCEKCCRKAGLIW